MYLRGLGGSIDVRMADGSIRSFSKIDNDLGNALLTGTPLIGPATQFQGGWLIRGCPLNVLLGDGWVPGQQEALRAAGITQCLPSPDEISSTRRTGPSLTKKALVQSPGVPSPAGAVQVFTQYDYLPPSIPPAASIDSEPVAAAGSGALLAIGIGAALLFGLTRKGRG